MQMRSELAQGHGRMNWRAVTDNVQIRLLEVHNALAFGIFDPSVSNVPFVGNGPIKDFGSAWHFLQDERKSGLQLGKRLTHPIAGNAAANRIQGR